MTSFDYHFYCWTKYSPWSIPCYTYSCAGWVYTDPVPAVGDILPECVPPRLGLLRTQPPWASQQPLRLQEAAQPNTQLFQVQDLNFGFVSPFWFHLCSCIFWFSGIKDCMLFTFEYIASGVALSFTIDEQLQYNWGCYFLHASSAFLGLFLRFIVLWVRFNYDNLWQIKWSGSFKYK